MAPQFSSEASSQEREQAWTQDLQKEENKKEREVEEEEGQRRERKKCKNGKVG